MADLFKIQERYEDYAKANAWSEADAPAPFAEGVKASFDQLVREETSIARGRNWVRKVQERAVEIGKLGGDEHLARHYQLELPQEFMGRLRELEKTGELESSTHWHIMDQRTRAAYLHVRKFETMHPDKVKTDEQLRAEMSEDFAKLRTVENDTMARAPWLSSFVGAMGGAMTDPLVLATLPLGGGLRTAGSSALGTAARMAGTEAAIAGATEIPIQAMVYQYKKEIDSPWSFQQAAVNVLAASAGGGIFGGIIGGAGQAGRNYLEPRRVAKAAEELRRQMDKGAIILNRAELEALETLEAGAFVDMRNPFTAEGHTRVVMGTAVDDVPQFANELEAFHFALEVAQRQHEAGLPVDVEDVIGDYLDFYHGTPHELEDDVFKFEFMGTGEGVQARGHGGYLAEDIGVGTHYKDILSTGIRGSDAPVFASIGRALRIERADVAHDIADGGMEALNKIIKEKTESISGDNIKAVREFSGDEQADDFIKFTKQELIELITLRDTGDLSLRKGNLYKARIAKRHVDNMLDLDKPINEQAEGVQTALRQAYPEIYDEWIDEGITGDEFYKKAALIEGAGETPAGFNVSYDKPVSEALLEAGIPGNIFLDGNSRPGGEGTRNVVFFDPRIVEVVERNGQPIQRPAKVEAPRVETPEPETPEITYPDKRLIRSTYRDALQSLSDDLTQGGGMAPITEYGSDVISGRLKSVNPKWFQDMVSHPETKVSVLQAQNAVAKALKGGKLGARQQRVVELMLDVVQEERVQAAEGARELLEAARSRREAILEREAIMNEPPRSIVKDSAIEPDDPYVASRTGILDDDDYMAVFEEYDQLMQDSTGGKIMQETDGDLIVRNVDDVIEEMNVMDDTLNDIRVCSIGGRS